MEKIIDSPKRYVPIAEYARITKAHPQTVKHNLEAGILKGLITPAGHWRVDTQADNPEYSAIIERLDRQEQLIKALSNHFGVKA